MKNRLPRKFKKEIKKDIILEGDISIVDPMKMGLIDKSNLRIIDKNGVFINLRIRF